MTSVEATESERDWHALDTDAVLAALGTPHGGLSEEEAARRLAQYGPNRLPEAKERSAFIRFLLQFHNLLIYVLIGAGALAAAIGQ
ncbi:MAG: cation-transporting P-type ATPase, partial [Nitratireductor sp.]